MSCYQTAKGMGMSLENSDMEFNAGELMRYAWDMKP